MPAPYYDTNAAAPLAVLPRRIDIGERDRRVDPANPEAVGILRLVPATPPKGFQIVASHGELIDGQWREVIDATKSLADVEAEQLAAAQAEAEAAGRVEALREGYRQSTRNICALAGMEPADKLEDMAFVDARGAAMQRDFVTTSVLCDNLTYCLFQLYRLDGDNAWAKI